MPNNILANRGLEEIAKQIGSLVSHCAIGDGSTEPQFSDVALGSEEARNAVGTRYTEGTQVQLRSLFTNRELPAQIEEIGWFINGGPAADSGILLHRGLQSYDPQLNDILMVIDIRVERLEEN